MHPFLTPDFHIRWSTLTPEHIEPDIRHALDLSTRAVAAICAQDLTAVCYESTFLALEHATEVLNRGWERLNHLDSVADHPAQREALNRMLPEVTGFYSSIPLNERLWAVLKAFGEGPAVKALAPIQQRFVAETLADFRQAGADLAAPEKLRIAVIEAELSQLTKQYSEHVLDSTNAWDLVVTDRAQLAGLPESAIAGAAASARAKGVATDELPAWRFTLQFPSMFPIMQYAHDDALRHQVWLASGQVGGTEAHDNSQLVWRILELRQEKANLLGHPHFADLTLLRRMAKTGASALAFIENLHARIAPAFLADFRQLAAYKAAATGRSATALEPWEIAYWAECQRMTHYDLDDEALRPYFPVDGVMSGMFEIASRLFAISIRQVETICPTASLPGNPESKVETWHPEVAFYEIHDAQSAAHLGSFYADWHPRESKRGGAWMNSLHTGDLGEPHLGLIIGNMSPPVAGQTALLTHREVETIFHEFGHLLHGLLSQVPVKSLSGTNVPWDFVELPSQIMENFCWDRQALDLFARHYQSGAVIPDELFAKMLAARNYLGASAFMRQLALAKLDLELHIHLHDWRGQDLDAVDLAVLADYRPPLQSSSPSTLRRFTHVFGSPTGYAAGYYSYKWSEVLDADAFTRFQNEGILNPETGRSFREHILSQGNSAPADELFRRFMGRDPELDPLLVRAGLA